VRVLLFWASVCQAVWTLIGYPLSLLVLPARPWRRREDTPPVTIMMAAYYEAEELRAKLEALRGLDYPSDRLQVIVVSDGNPELIAVAEKAYPAVEAILMPERGGKPRGFNTAMARATGEMIVLTDANNVLDPGCVRAAVRHFGDPSIAAVAGTPAETGSAYDVYESLLQRLESRSGSVAGMSGGLCVIRRDKLPPLEDYANEDLWLLCHLVREGGRVIHDPEVRSSEPTLDPAKEYRRRSRLGAGRMVLLTELAGLPAGYRLRLISHKVARLVLPFSLAVALVTSVTLVRRPLYAALAAAQILIHGIGALSLAGVRPSGPAGRLAQASGQFLLGNLGVARGVVRGARGGQTHLWQPTRR
jgi:cellulose synthase/poly-beta-1,6-N-acetylglucosamine synthase-like glycosyltransferase